MKMTTKTPEQLVTVQPSYNNCNREESSYMEQKRFNSGPQANKTLPNMTYRPTNIDLAPTLMEVDEQEDRPLSSIQPPASSSANSDSLCLFATSESLSSKTPPPSQQNFLPPFHPLSAGNTPFPHSTPPSAQHLPGNSNDSTSNLSNGGSGSDKEAEAAAATAYKPISQTTVSSTPNTPETTKAPRKRKNTEAKTTPKNPRKDRKINEFYKDSHANNNLSNILVQQNGDNFSSDLNSAGTSYSRTNDNTNSECIVESTTGSSISDIRIAELNHLNKQLEKAKLELCKEKTRAKSYREVIRDLLVEKARAARMQAEEKSNENQLRIGHFKQVRAGEHFKEQWRNGHAFEQLESKLESINKNKVELQNSQQNLRKQKPSKSSKKALSNDSAGGDGLTTLALGRQNSTPTMDDGFLRPEIPRQPKEMSSQDVYENEEIMKIRKKLLIEEEQDLLAEKERLERERNLHIREMKRIQCEKQSRFKNFQSLHNERYLLLSLLGKGGFSEVWRAYDLEENRYVACKIHHVNKEWKEDKKANYVKHAMREKDIHKSLNHSRIVRLFDVFSIDSDSFCTVLEYCDGNDLDFYLKQHKQMKENEARSIIMQIVNALKYLSERPNPIIHYDLKPANILLQSGSAIGEIKITDFGLSKQIENSDDGESIELTSQGAGTYWYLPPETFQNIGIGYGGAPKISSKVDVWSVGVILYQCLYGKRPFGNDRTQQQILEERIILGAKQVEFPPTTGQQGKVSQQAQEFIRKCLQYNKEERADVNQLYEHEFLNLKSRKSVSNV